MLVWLLIGVGVVVSMLGIGGGMASVSTVGIGKVSFSMVGVDTHGGIWLLVY